MGEGKERPILFSGPMVRALLDGRKTQTRRVVKGMALSWLEDGFTPQFVADPDNSVCPYGRSGDRLWVRESGLQKDGPLFKLFAHDASPGRYWTDTDGGRYGASYGAAITRESMIRSGWKVRPSIHMPRWASRLTLEISEIRVERLQDISDRGQPNDCIAEGVFASDFATTAGDWMERGFSSIERCRFHDLWTSINGADSWTANPWVWVVSFNVSRATAPMQEGE